MIVKNKIRFINNGKNKFMITLKNKDTMMASERYEFEVNIDFEETDVFDTI